VKSDVILAKLESLERCIRRVEQKRPDSMDHLMQDLDRQDVIVLNLERAIQQCVDIGTHILVARGYAAPESMAGVFAQLADAGVVSADIASRLKNAVGFRNIAVHQYEKLSLSVVYSIITEQLDDFRKFSAAILKLL
jgi:uncharacterized protein YutE (UPF0331/DUF86 family)